MNENPWAYQEARNRIREKTEQEMIAVEKKSEDFEKTKKVIRKKYSLDVYWLRNSIDTGNSLHTLKSDVMKALKEGVISRDTYDSIIASIDHESERHIPPIDPNKLPFSQNQFAKYLEDKRLWENIWADIAWFMYAFIIQGIPILIIIAWKILMDFFSLPRDIYRAIQKSDS